jgi:hypothetical protein
MRKPFHLIITLLSLAAILPVTAQEAATDDPSTEVARPAETDQTSEKIIHLHLRARGGLKALRQSPQITMKGELVEGYQDYKLLVTLDAPGRIRVETTRRHMGDDYVIVTASDGSNAWRQETIPERKNPTKIKGLDKQLLELDAMLPFLFWDHKSAGHVFTYKGKDTFAKREAYLLGGRLGNGIEIEVLFDSKSFHIINYRHLYRIGGKEIQIDRAPAGLARIGDTWWEKGYVYRLRGKSFREINYDRIEPAGPPPQDSFTEPPTYERWLKIKR